MARKGKNDSLKIEGREQEGKKSSRKTMKIEATTADCGNSIDVLPYLITSPMGPSAQRETAVDRVAKLRRLYTKEFGFKPVGMSEAKLDEVLSNRGVDVINV